MRLISFSVEKYRSISTARKIPVENYTLLIGPNNEGKSNILHALTLGMQALVNWRERMLQTSDGRLIAWPMYARSGYSWDRDFPVRLQSKYPNGVSNTILGFGLSVEEVAEFKNTIGSSLNGSLSIQISFGHRRIDVSI